MSHVRDHDELISLCDRMGVDAPETEPVYTYSSEIEEFVIHVDEAMIHLCAALLDRIEDAERRIHQLEGDL